MISAFNVSFVDMLKSFKKKLRKRFCKRKPLRDIVLVFPFNTDTKEILIIQEYVQHYEKSFWKFVSGGIDKNNKDSLTHAREELAEELGLESDSFYLFHFFEPYFGSRSIYCFVAENPRVMVDPPENPDIDIIEQTRWVDVEGLQVMIDNKELIWNESTMVALQIFRSYTK